jgi:hypothetical protein
VSNHPATSNDAQNRGRAFTVSAAALALLLGYLSFKAEVRTDVHLILGLLIALLATGPALAWVKKGKSSMPVFEVFMLTGLNSYAFPLLNGHESLLLYSDGDITTAALAVVFFQIAAIATYEATIGLPLSGSFWRTELITRNAGRWLLHGVTLNCGYTCLTSFTTVVPASLEGTVRAVFFGIGLVCTFVTAHRLGAGELTTNERIYFFSVLLVQCLVSIATLFLVGAVSTLVLTVIGYVSNSRRVPFLASIAILLLLAILHNGKAAMREIYWEHEERTMPTPAQLPAFFVEWFRQGLKPAADETESRMTAKLVERTSLLQMMCLVAAVSPSQQPFLKGETYKDIPAQFIPRFLWADKPLGHVSTSKLAVYYGLQNEEDTEKTTIGFGLLAEAYANFGYIGIVGIGIFFGYFIKKAQCWAAESPILSGGGLLIVILLAWSFQTEFTLSMWLASFYQAGMALLVLPYVIRTFIQG